MNEKVFLNFLKGIMIVEIVLIVIFLYIANTKEDICPPPQNDWSISTVPTEFINYNIFETEVTK